MSERNAAANIAKTRVHMHNYTQTRAHVHASCSCVQESTCQHFACRVQSKLTAATRAMPTTVDGRASTTSSKPPGTRCAERPLDGATCRVGAQRNSLLNMTSIRWNMTMANSRNRMEPATSEVSVEIAHSDEPLFTRLRLHTLA